MKKFLLSLIITFIINIHLSAFGLFMEGGMGYNTDENVGLGFIVSTEGLYTGIGAGFVFWLPKIDSFVMSLGVNLDYLISPSMGFVRGEERYDIHNMADRASLRVMPYLQVSRNVISKWLYMGFGLGYSNTGLYFGMRPLIYDTEYTSYHLSSNAVSPLFFLRTYIFSGLYLSINYEADIVINGNLRKLAGDPLMGFNNIDGATDIRGVHHRARMVIGYVLGFD